MVFLGNSDVLLDAKNRLAIPAKFRRNLDPERDGTAWVVFQGTPPDTLSLYPEKVFLRLVEKGESSLISDEDQRKFDQAFFPHGELLEPDGQGRILIPERLLQATGLSREVVVCGTRNRLEIWKRDVFRRHESDSRERLPELEARARKAYQDSQRQPGR